MTGLGAGMTGGVLWGGVAPAFAGDSGGAGGVGGGNDGGAGLGGRGSGGIRGG